jgi:hypothetical protein
MDNNVLKAIDKGYNIDLLHDRKQGIYFVKISDHRGNEIIKAFPESEVDKNSQSTIFTVANKDTYIGPFTLCPKEVLQKSYIDKIGHNIDYCGTLKKVISVKITEDSIIVEMI